MLFFVWASPPSLTCMHILIRPTNFPFSSLTTQSIRDVDDSTIDPTRHHHQLQRQTAVDRQRARRRRQLAELVPDDPVHPQVHGEHPRAVVLTELADVQVHGQAAHAHGRHRVRAPRALERHRHLGAAEALALVQPRRLDPVVVDGHAPVGVRDFHSTAVRL
uniref:Uncharacterized protein n=1 Tax=Setaria italica TaxID=4555 RepID=K3XMP7_SETIT